LITLILVGVFIISINSSLAQSSILDTEGCNCNNLSSATSECRKYCTGDYELNDLVRVLVTYYEMVFGFIGSIALLFFIYGGITFLTSAGNIERVTKAKQILVGSVIGLIIVFTSYMIVQFTLKSLGVVDKDGQFIDSGIEGKWQEPPK